CQEISVRYDGKSASRLREKPLGGLCAVLPYILSNKKAILRRSFPVAILLFFFLKFQAIILRSSAHRSWESS
ncbi:hypothetical protein, partial [Ruminococcus sp.]